MSVERAIVQFVAEGVSDVESAGDRVVKTNAGIKDSADQARAAEESAKTAAQEAEKSARELSHEIRETMHALHAAARVAESLARAAGVEEDSPLGEGLDVAGGVVSGGLRGARLGGRFGPEGAAIGALIGAFAGGAEKLNEISKRDKEREEKLREFDQKQREHETTDAMLRQLGLAKADATFGGPRRVE